MVVCVLISGVDLRRRLLLLTIARLMVAIAWLLVRLSRVSIVPGLVLRLLVVIFVAVVLVGSVAS